MNFETVLLVGGGLVLLGIGAEFVVRGAARVAAEVGVSPLVLGLTIVSIGTSFPELLVGITAGLQGKGSLAVGNIAGTNMVNLLFILGLSAFMRPLAIHLRLLRHELPMMVMSAALVLALAFDGTLTRIDGGILLALAVVYTISLVRLSRREGRQATAEYREAFEVRGRNHRLMRGAANIALLIAGIVICLVGADWLVSGSVTIAEAAGVSDAFIGLTIVAIGTSAPEIATTLVATWRNERDVAVGNLIGSSIYNLLAILGVAGMVPAGGIEVDRALVVFDLPVMLMVAVVCVPVFVTGREVTRVEGGAFVAGYAVYIAVLIAFWT